MVQIMGRFSGFLASERMLLIMIFLIGFNWLLQVAAHKHYTI